MKKNLVGLAAFAALNGGAYLFMAPELIARGVVIADGHPAWVVGATLALALLMSVVAHELGHWVMAQVLGVPSQIHFRWWGGFLEPEESDDVRPGGDLAITVAGPMMNLALFGLAWWVIPWGMIASCLALMNAFMVIVSIPPAIGFDGGNAVFAVVWWLTGNKSHGRAAAAVSSLTTILAVAAGTWWWFFS